jgi:hypothetical protein
VLLFVRVFPGLEGWVARFHRLRLEVLGSELSLFLWIQITFLPRLLIMGCLEASNP